jgi:uncharacterized protein YggE
VLTNSLRMDNKAKYGESGYSNVPFAAPKKNTFLNVSIIITLFSFLALTALIGGSIVYFQYLRYQDGAKSSQINVTGSAEKKVKYDKITLSFTISKTGTDTTALNKTVDELTTKTQDILTKAGIKKNNIQTNKSSYPDYSNIYGVEPQKDGNTNKNTVFDVRFTVKIEDLQNNLDLPNTLTKQLTDLGINRFDPYQYEIADQKSICEELKTQAITDAREKGINQIKAIGGKKIVSTQIQAGGDSCDNIFYPIPYATLGKADAISAAPISSTPEVITGEKTITQQVSVTFEYR